MSVYKEYGLPFAENIIAFWSIEGIETEMVGAHWHDYWEMLYVVEGNIHQTLDSSDVFVQEGEVVFAAPKTIHATYSGKNGCKLVTVLFSLSEEDSIRSGLSEIKSGCFTGELLYKSEIKSLFLKLRAEYAEKLSGYNVIMHGIIHEIIGYLTRSVVFTGKSAEKTEIDFYKIKKALKYIEDNLSKSLSVAEVASVAGYSSEYFTRLCKKYTGFSYKTYLDKLKMTEAIRMLTFENKTVSETAFLLGYTDSSSFYRTFKRINGFPPSDLLSGKSITSKSQKM